MSERTAISLGNIVTSPIYGVEGTATQFTYNSPNRVRQVGITLISDAKNTVGETLFIDENLVDYKDVGFVDRLVPLRDNPFTYGDKVREKMTGYECVVTGWVEMMNGCIDIVVASPTLDKDGQPRRLRSVELDRLEFIVPKSTEATETIQEPGIISRAVDAVKDAVIPKSGCEIRRGRVKNDF